MHPRASWRWGPALFEFLAAKLVGLPQVVLPALVLIREDSVRLIDLFEHLVSLGFLFFGPRRIPVRMPLHRQLLVRLLDLILGGLLLDPQDLVVVLPTGLPSQPFRRPNLLRKPVELIVA